MSEQQTPEVTLAHVDAARAVLVHLGYAISPSREPGADDRVDRVASALAAEVERAVATERERLVALCENVIYEYRKGSPERKAAERALSVVRGA